MTALEAPIWIAGTMSGTSLDGVDASLLRTDGARIEAFGPSAYRPYDDAERAALKAALSAAAARSTGDLRADPRPFPDARRIVTDAHRAVLAELIERAETLPELIAVHGQTLIHRPDARYTLQTIDAEALAQALQTPVAYDFRTADVAAGGQGAPLAPFHHFALLKSAGETAPAAVLNLGGVGNVSFLDPASEDPAADGAILAFDTGPANALLDDWMQAGTGARYDADGRAAAAGRADETLVAKWMAHAYFAARPPKSLDRDAFAVMPDLAGRATEEGAATLARFTAASVAAAARWAPKPPERWFATGGGRRNPTLMRMISDALGCGVEPIEALTVAGAPVDGDMLEARAFAQLGARVLAGLPLTAPGTTGAPRPLTGGRIIRPA